MFESVGVEGVCDLRKREKKTSYLVFLEVSKAYECVEAGIVIQEFVKV